MINEKDIECLEEMIEKYKLSKKLLKRPPYIKKEIKTLTSLLSLAKLVMSAEGEFNIEKICEAVHKAYCKYHIEHKGKEYWTKGDYNKLNEEGKEYDRRTVKAVLKEITPLYLKLKLEVEELKKHPLYILDKDGIRKEEKKPIIYCEKRREKIVKRDYPNYEIVIIEDIVEN